MFFLNYTSIIDPILRSLRRFVPDFAGMQAGERVMDVCCGSGAQAYEYANRGMLATGIDISPHMLKLAGRYRKKAVALNLSFLLADAVSLPFAAGSFDHASISLALHEKDVALQNSILSEMKRVVKQNGGLILIDYSHPLPRSLFGFTIRMVELLAGTEHHRCFRSYLRRGGLEAVTRQSSMRVAQRTLTMSGTMVIMKAVNA